MTAWRPLILAGLRAGGHQLSRTRFCKVVIKQVSLGTSPMLRSMLAWIVWGELVFQARRLHLPAWACLSGVHPQALRG